MKTSKDFLRMGFIFTDSSFLGFSRQKNSF